MRKTYRQKETNRQREIETDRQRKRDTDRQRKSYRERETDRGDRFTHRKPEAETERPKYFISKALPTAAKVISRRNTSLQTTNHSLIH